MELPAFSEMFQIQPWDIPHLTLDELAAFRAYLRERANQ